MMSNFSLSSLALLVLIARAACARRTFDYTTFSFSFTDASNSYDAELGVDLHNPAQQTQGRANVIAMQRTGLSQSLASYPLFDGSFLLELPSTSTSLCVYTEYVLFSTLFHFGSWLPTAREVLFSNGDALYWTTSKAPISFPHVTPKYMYVDQISNANISLFFPSGSALPSRLAISLVGASTPNVVYFLSNFAPDVQRFSDELWAPPNDACITSPLACPGSWPTVTMDFFRVHDNSTYAHVLENANAADPAGEARYVCGATTSEYITQFRVRLSTRWNTYGECNAGACIYTSANTTPQLRGYTLGVGRERTYGDGQGDSTGQCDTPAQDPHVGYWFSFADGGRCDFGDKVGDKNCTWEADYVPVKTITKTCANMTQHCKGPSVNWTLAGDYLLNAFVHCPAVNAFLTPMSTPYMDWIAANRKENANSISD